MIFSQQVLQQHSCRTFNYFVSSITSSTLIKNISGNKLFIIYIKNKNIVLSSDNILKSFHVYIKAGMIIIFLK